MAVRRIVTTSDRPDIQRVLRQKSKKIHRVDESIKRLIEDLIDTVYAAHGAGLSAPQIGVPLRALVNVVGDKVQVVLNPEIVEESDEEIESEEGCLSIPGWWAPVTRKERVVIRGLGRTGKSVKIKSEGYEARCFQHEIDHLNGILFTDHIKDKSKLHKVESDEEEEELEQEELYA